MTMPKRPRSMAVDQRTKNRTERPEPARTDPVGLEVARSAATFSRAALTDLPSLPGH